MKGDRMVTGLSQQGCMARLQRLADALRNAGLNGALIFNPQQVHALSGLWHRAIHRSVLLVLADGSSYLAAPGNPSVSFATQVYPVVADKLGTLIDDQVEAALQLLHPHVSRLQTLGVDCGLPSELIPGVQVRIITPLLRSLQRRKLPDEVELIRAGVLACEACYAFAKKNLRPGIDEISLYAQLLAAATEAVGEPIGEFGNDFQSGTPGGPARHREMKTGELLPLDLSVVVRGYRADVCRTFCVGAEPKNLQRDAHKKVAEVLSLIEGRAGPGSSCRELYETAFALLDGYRGLRFPHHLGHGIGLSTHEAPRLNPHWDDVLQEGDVFTLEPGLYGEKLKGGIRLEQNYLVTANGLSRLSSFPLDLQTTGIVEAN